MNPLREAQRQGIKAVNDLGVLFGRLGTTQHPNAAALVAYRAANRAIRDTLINGGGLTAAREITRKLTRDVKAGVAPVFLDASRQGYQNAARQLLIYKDRPPAAPDLTREIEAAYGVIEASLQKQEAAMLALMLSGSDAALITGDENRQGVFRASEVIMAAAFWAASLWWSAFDSTASQAGGRYRKQAVAALDARTTDCCLRVHGQIQALSAPFHLTGTPRYADYLDWPPFHGWCRTSGVLYLETYDDGLTVAMQDSATQVLSEREAGVFKDRHPADAFI